MHGNHTTRVGNGSAPISACISVTSASTLTRDGVGGDPLGPDITMQEQPPCVPEPNGPGGSAGWCLPCSTAPPRMHGSRRKGGIAMKLLCSRLSGLGIHSLARNAGESATVTTITAAIPRKSPSVSRSRKEKAKKSSKSPGGNPGGATTTPWTGILLSV